MKIAWSISASGTPAFYPMADDALQLIRSTLSMMQFVVTEVPPAAPCKTCLGRTGYMCLLGDELEDQLVVLWDLVLWGQKQINDSDHKFFNFFSQVFDNARKVAAVSLLEDWTAGSADGADDPGGVMFSPCSCGGPRDFQDWSRRKTLLSNSCYNYAAKDLWVFNGHNTGGARGAFASPDPDVWRTTLAPHGLAAVTDWNEIPAHATANGWHAALALKRETGLTNFHFLRLDNGTHWSHKWSTLPPQLCDLSGKPILRDGIHQADLCGYEVKAFFWAEPPTHTS